MTATSIRWLLVCSVFLCVTSTPADDWPQWRGLHRDGAWNERGIMEPFPPGGLSVTWRAPIGAGLSSPVVARGRVYVSDSTVEKPRAWERINCFDEKTGKLLWTHSYEVKYPEWGFDPNAKTGPGSTPIVENDRLFCVGATSQLVCLDARRGAELWKRDLIRDYGLEDFENTTPSPLIEGRLLILAFGGKPDACVVAFDKLSGKEVWRALTDQRTYSSPIVITAGGRRQLIVWTPAAVTSLDPLTGKTLWREPLTTQGDHVIATPVREKDLLLVSGLMFRLDDRKPAAEIVWPETKALTARILSQTSLPLIQGGYIYSDKSYGHLVCLEAGSGKEIWREEHITGSTNGASIHITPNGNSVLLYTDQGNLIRARLGPEGYRELSRTHLMDPTYRFAGRNVVWPPPAYANRHVFVRNDEEIVCASLAADAKGSK